MININNEHTIVRLTTAMQWVTLLKILSFLCVHFLWYHFSHMHWLRSLKLVWPMWLSTVVLDFSWRVFVLLSIYLSSSVAIFLSISVNPSPRLWYWQRLCIVFCWCTCKCFGIRKKCPLYWLSIGISTVAPDDMDIDSSYRIVQHFASQLAAFGVIIFQSIFYNSGLLVSSLWV